MVLPTAISRSLTRASLIFSSYLFLVSLVVFYLFPSKCSVLTVADEKAEPSSPVPCQSFFPGAQCRASIGAVLSRLTHRSTVFWDDLHLHFGD